MSRMRQSPRLESSCRCLSGLSTLGLELRLPVDWSDIEAENSAQDRQKADTMSWCNLFSSSGYLDVPAV